MNRYSVFFLLILSAVSVFATGMFRLDPVRTIEGDAAYPFVRAELLCDDHSGFSQEQYHPKNQVSHPGLLNLLSNSKSPHGKYFVLHYVSGWEKAGSRNPVLLIHGAGDTAYRGWMHPFAYEIDPGQEIKYPGLAVSLAKRGFQVFAVTFPHPHGDNFMQSEHVANAITRIRKALGRENDQSFKIDLITHSKGGVAARMYLSDIRDEYSEYSWLTPFRGDVERFFSVATPLKGIDAMYRYYGVNLSIVEMDMAAPCGADSIVYYGMNINCRSYHDCFTGQFQMLHNWVDDEQEPIPFSNLSATAADFNYSRDKLYYGGTSVYLASSGIDQGIRKGRNLIAALNEKGIDPSVRPVILAGNDNLIQDDFEDLVNCWPMGENEASSDSLLFVRSALYTQGLLSRGARPIAVKVIPYNHMNIIIHKDAQLLIIELLNR
ncbi:MAG: hypothetical protein PHQ23_14065 [Candidatus Wallbacteria bacterium]|nr:hypothetical protein [Candidatus Wallbacteria bacterium]